VSKLHQNLLVEILKVLPNSEIYLNLKKNLSIFPLSTQPAIQPFWPNHPPACPSSPPFHHAGPPLPQAASLGRPSRPNLWRIPQNTLSSLIRAFPPWSLLPLPSLTYGPRLSALSNTPRQPISGHAATKSRRVRPPSVALASPRHGCFAPSAAPHPALVSPFPLLQSTE
jgi:hypothetical protein